MKHLIIASPTILAALVVLVISLRAMYRARRDAEELRTEYDKQIAEIERQVGEQETEVSAQLAARPAGLVVELDLPDDAIPDLPTASEQARSLVSSLSDQERALGGAGLTLTAAKVESGAVRLTLSPVERVGSAERVRRVADEWNARGGPLPPGVTAARADVFAA